MTERRAEEGDVQYWYNVESGQVESDDERSPGTDVLGPYDTAEEAGRALEIARSRTEKWDAEDRAWDERGAGPGPRISADDQG